MTTGMALWHYFAGEAVETTIADRGAIVDAWVRSLTTSHRSGGDSTIVGLDCKWRPNFFPLMNNRTALLQLCVDSKCIIIQLLYLDYIPESLRAFLASDDVVFVGVEIDRDVERLRFEYGLTCVRTADLRELALSRMPHKFTSSKPGLEEIALSVLELHMLTPSHVTLSDWQRRLLNYLQIGYACLDTYAAHRIGRSLLSLG